MGGQKPRRGGVGALAVVPRLQRRLDPQARKFRCDHLIEAEHPLGMVAQRDGAGEQADAPGAPADEAPGHRTGGAPGRQVVDSHEVIAPGVGHVGHQRDHRHAAVPQLVDRGPDAGMIQRHDADTVEQLAQLLQRGGERERIEHVDPPDLH